ncbi:hypothetical protein WG904_05125 [Pedobacter sp. Du54]|uniref:hypothetical protein n=1 Tax=Pedobacter anseongensis TaxID=3133439 RepID=UPI003099D4AA
MKCLNPKRYIKPQKAVKILKEHGQEVSYEQAELILDFMYKFGQLAIDIYVPKDEKGDENRTL